MEKLTRAMNRAFDQMTVKGLTYLDGRSGDALVRRGLASRSGFQYSPTEKALDMVATEEARQQVISWQVESHEYFSPTICEVVRSYAKWRNRQRKPMKIEPAGKRP